MRTHLQLFTMVTLVMAKDRHHVTPECGSEWRILGVDCYHVGDVRASFTHASSICNGLASQLVSLHSTKEADFLLSLLKGYDRVWLGLEKEEEEEEEVQEEEEEDGWSWIANFHPRRSWRWTDDSLLTYTSWDNPDALPQSPYNCVSLDTRTALWQPTPCLHLHNFVCKKPCRQCQTTADLPAGDTDGRSGSEDTGAANLRLPSPFITQQRPPQPLRTPEGVAAGETQGMARPANSPTECKGACGRTFHRLSTTPKTWQEAQKDCLEGKGRVAMRINRVSFKLAQRLAHLGMPLWVRGRHHEALTLPKTGAVRTPTAPCRVALPGSGHTTTVSCLRHHHYLCEYTYGQTATPRPSPGALAAPARPRAPCVSGWHLSGGRCYRAFSTWVTWSAAEDICMSHGGHLVSVGDDFELTSLRRLSLGRMVASPVWIGFRRKVGDLQGFEWVDGTPFRSQGWEQGQPDHHQGRERCGAATLPNFALQDVVCLTLLPFVCEAEAGNMSEVSAPFPSSITLLDEVCEGDPAWLRRGEHCYKLVGAEDLLPWRKAQERCLQEGASLASVNSLEENYWLQEKLLRASVGTDAVWLGGRVEKMEEKENVEEEEVAKEEEEEDYYSWIDRTPFNFTNWAPGEPNNVHDQEDCLSLYPRRQGYWNDQNCGTPSGRVCKRPLQRPHHQNTVTPTATSPPSTVALALQCPQSWITAPGGTMCFKYFDVLKDFEGARATCRKEGPGTDLVSVHSAAQQAYLTVMARLEGIGTWLGMRKQGKTYLWMDQMPVTYTSWAQGEPSGAKGTVLVRRGWRGRELGRRPEECVEFLTHSRAGQWNDVACTERRAFICQTPVEVQSGDLTRSPAVPAVPVCPSTSSLYLRIANHCYRYVPTPLSWQAAEDTCARDGGHLATTLTRTEAAAVWVVAMEGGLKEAWLGLRQEGEHGAVKWSSGWPLLHAPWSSDTTTNNNNNSIREGMCTALTSSNGQWVLRPCLTARPFICHLINDVAGVTVRAPRGSCPDGRWLEFGGSSCYLVVREPKPWHDARYSCILEGGDLTSIASAAEMRLVGMAVHDVMQAVWIGLLREKNGQRWTDGLRVTYTNWNEGEPNGGSGLCTEVYTNTGRWNDVACRQVRPFICKHFRR